MTRALAALVLTALVATVLTAQTKGPKTARRAQPPPPTKLKSDLFFADAFKEGLVGERPADLGKAAAASGGNVATSVPSGSSSAGSGSAAPAAAGNWSGLISAGTIEDTIKSLKQQVDKDVTTLSDFKGKGHKLARRDYSLLAMLFGIAGEYDGEVRWKKDAAAARDAFGRSAANFKVATDQAFNEAKARKEELNELVSGSSPYAGKSADAKATWNQVADRAPLMQYLESAWEPRLKPALGEKTQFNSSGDKVLRDAELFAAIGAVLAKDGMKDAGDAEYQAFCNRLRDASKQIIEAVKQKDFESASKASSAIGKACTECHENYRS
jgi:hypothetical protein